MNAQSQSAPPVRVKALVRSVVLGLLTLLVLPHLAGAFVYYGDTNNFAVGRAGPAGDSPFDPFVPLMGSAMPCGVAVDGSYIYWGDKLYGRIGRARIDGEGTPDASFIVGASEPCGISVFDHHLYWVNQSTNGSIARANLTGPLDVHENFVPSEQGSGRNDLNEPCGVAVDQTGIYWTTAIGGAVGHANLDGSGETTLIPGGPAQGCGIALAGGDVYWAHNPYNSDAASIARLALSGGDVNYSYITGLNGPCGLASYSHYLYFADGATLDRADLTSADPTAATEQIVLGTTYACGVAVDSLYAGRFVIVRRDSRPHGIVRLMVRVSNPGVILIRPTSGVRALRDKRVAAGHAGVTTITLYPTAAARRRLFRQRIVKARVRVEYVPTGGVVTTKTTSVSLARR